VRDPPILEQPDYRRQSNGETGGMQEVTVLLLGHLDTVFPEGETQKRPFRVDGNRASGPGVFDMKAGILLMWMALGNLGATENVTVLLTSDEEVGSATSRAAIEDEARRSDAVLVLEPSLPGGAVKTARKGCGEYELRVRGVAAHAGIDPSKGASAIHELARQIVLVQKLQDLDWGISVNVGTISGGTRTNVVAEEARAVVDVRAPTQADAARVDAAFRALKAVDDRTAVSVTGGLDRPPLERTAQVARLYKQASEVARELGHALGEGSTGGGSDGNFTAALGVATLDGLGAVGDGAHALHEHVVIESLTDRAALVAGLIARIE
jgi:glutamate carboxypeptidase